MLKNNTRSSEQVVSRTDVTRQAELVVMEYLKSTKCTQTLDAMMQQLKVKSSSATASELYAVDLDGKKKKTSTPQAYTSVLEYMVQASSNRTASTPSTRTPESGDDTSSSSSSKPRRRRSSLSAGSDSENGGGDAVWSKDDVSRLRKAIKQTSVVEDKNERWREIAALVGNGKSKKHCYVKYKELKDEKKSGGSRDASPSAPPSRSSSRRASDDTSGKRRADSQREPNQTGSLVPVPAMMQRMANDFGKQMVAAPPLRAASSAAESRDALGPIDDTAAVDATARVSHASSGDDLQVEDVDDDLDAVQLTSAHSVKLNGGVSNSAGGARAATSAGANGTRTIGPSGRVPSADEVAVLQRLFFSDEKKAFSSHWEQQGFFFTDVAHLRYGLVQHEGGPCGVLAVVQAYVLRFLLESAPQDWQNPDRRQQQSALVAAMAHILHQASGSGRCTLVLNDRAESTLSGAAARRKFMSGVALHTTTNESETCALLTEQLAQFTAPRGNGLVLFVLSVALSKGVVEIKREMDQVEGVSDTNSGGRLIGAHDYCAQEMVNLLLCGQACSNVFNGSQLLEGSSKDDPHAVVLKGVAAQATVGFLSLFEAYEYLIVGSHLKHPTFNIWVVCSESHYSVLFAEPALLRDAALDACMALDLYYYDGLANQDEVIRLSVTTAANSRSSSTADTGDDSDDDDARKGKNTKPSDDLVPPLNLVIQTKWPRATIDWHDVEPLL